MLDDIDRAYFAGDATQRAQLAVRMMHEDPTAFREMVFEGLRALEEAGKRQEQKRGGCTESYRSTTPSANNPTRASQTPRKRKLRATGAASRLCIL